jgi:hypothetical protein
MAVLTYTMQTWLQKVPDINNVIQQGSGIKKESQRVFIHTGQLNADGYGVLIGFDSDGKLLKSTGYGNYQYGNDVRLATEQEIKSFINEVFNYQNPIKEY